MTKNLSVINTCETCGHQLCARKVSLFKTLDDEQLKLVISLIKRKSIKKNDYILKQSDPINALYIVNVGKLKATRVDVDGNEHILNFIDEGESFGDLSLLKQTAISYDLVSMKTGHLCMISKSDFDDLILKHPKIMFSILESAHDRILNLENHMSALSSKDVDQRLKYLIQSLSNSSDLFKVGQFIQLDMTREEMANYVGVTRETISRKLSKLEKLGHIKFISIKKIKILNPIYFNNK